ncbi:hypothetical protein [Streptomyces erythrochromogenes]|uniref:hypothetical protein n=1 Tax=Streptomyces erythrochromogenes TaxID=285574 RepID=UPI0036F98E1A
MTAPVARRTCGLPVLVAFAALGLAGCGAVSAEPAALPAPASSPPPPSAPKAPPSRTMTAEQLVAAALPTGEMGDSDWHPVAVRELRRGDRGYEVSDPACGRLLEAADARRPSEPSPSVVDQAFEWEGDLWGGSSTLASYGNSGAVAVFEQVSEGLSNCRYYEAPGPASMYKGTVTAGRAPTLGDEAVQFEITAPSEMGPHVTQYTVVRMGSVIATFTKLSVGDDTVRAFPPALVAQQIALLRQAQS